MRVAVIGAGKVGGGLASRWRANGHDVAEVGRSDAVPEDAEAVLLAVPAGVAADVVAGRADELAGKVLIDATNDVSGQSACVADEVAGAAPAARVVKAFNTVFAALYDEIDERPRVADMAYCGDDEQALELTHRLIESAGFRPFACGGLEAAADLEGFARMVIRTAYGVGTGPFAYAFGSAEALEDGRSNSPA